MNDLPKLAYLRTNPHTGTHFMFDLLRCVDTEDFRFIGIHGGKMFGYMQQVIEGKLSYEDMMTGSLSRYGWPHTLKYFGIFEHLALPGTPPYKVSKTWLHDFTVHGYPGYPVKTIMPLRHYRDVILSILLQHSIDYNVEDRKDSLDWLQKGYAFMTDHVDDDNYFYVPVDRLGKRTASYRLNYIRKLFLEFLGVRIYEDYFHQFVTEWKPVHTARQLINFEEYENKNDEFRTLLKLKNSKRIKRGMHEEFDRQMAFFESHAKIQTMFKNYGYLK